MGHRLDAHAERASGRAAFAGSPLRVAFVRDGEGGMVNTLAQPRP